MGLTAIDEGAFTGLTSLSALDLSSNQLTTLPEGLFEGLASLSRLELTLNQLTTMPAGLFTGLTSLSALDLSPTSHDAEFKRPPRARASRWGLLSESFHWQ